MNPLWLGAALTGALIAFGGLLAGAVLGTRWGWAAATLALALVGLHHLRHVAKLVEWARAPLGTPLPQGNGLWDWVYAVLNRRARTALDERRALGESLQRLIEATHAMPDGVITLDGARCIDWLNHAAELHFGLDGRRDRGVPITNLVRAPDFAAYLSSGDYGEPLVLRTLRQPGQVVAVHVVRFGDDQTLILSRDVTHVEKLETMRRDFIANVSHELKTPLTVINGFIETVASDLAHLDVAEAQRFLALAQEQGQRMQRLVDDLLTLSRLETGSPPPLDEEVQVQPLLAAVVRDAQALSGGRHAIELQAGPPSVLLGAASELASAFGNLATNAVRYTPTGGRISVGWQTDAQGGAAFVVEDTGEGIDARHLPRLTERFYRVDRGRSQETGGTGLGLAIVKHVLTRHQARLEVASEPGRGSRFTCRFPPQRVLQPKRAEGAAPRS